MRHQGGPRPWCHLTEAMCRKMQLRQPGEILVEDGSELPFTVCAQAVCLCQTSPWPPLQYISNFTYKLGIHNTSTGLTPDHLSPQTIIFARENSQVSPLKWCQLSTLNGLFHSHSAFITVIKRSRQANFNRNWWTCFIRLMGVFRRMRGTCWLWERLQYCWTAAKAVIYVCVFVFMNGRLDRMSQWTGFSRLSESPEIMSKCVQNKHMYVVDSQN